MTESLLMPAVQRLERFAGALQAYNNNFGPLIIAANVIPPDDEAERATTVLLRFVNGKAADGYNKWIGEVGIVQDANVHLNINLLLDPREKVATATSEKGLVHKTKSGLVAASVEALREFPGAGIILGFIGGFREGSKIPRQENDFLNIPREYEQMMGQMGRIPIMEEGPPNLDVNGTLDKNLARLGENKARLGIELERQQAEKAEKERALQEYRAAKATKREDDANEKVVAKYLATIKDVGAGSEEPGYFLVRDKETTQEIEIVFNFPADFTSRQAIMAGKDIRSYFTEGKAYEEKAKWLEDVNRMRPGCNVKALIGTFPQERKEEVEIALKEMKQNNILYVKKQNAPLWKEIADSLKKGFQKSSDVRIIAGEQASFSSEEKQRLQMRLYKFITKFAGEQSISKEAFSMIIDDVVAISYDPKESRKYNPEPGKKILEELQNALNKTFIPKLIKDAAAGKAR